MWPTFEDDDHDMDHDMDHDKNVRAEAQTKTDDLESDHEFASHFRFPITYCPQRVAVDEGCKKDLELVSCVSNNEGDDEEGDDEENDDDDDDAKAPKTPKAQSMYGAMLEPHDVLTRKSIHQWSEYYTPNASFLRDTVGMLRRLRLPDAGLARRCYDAVYDDVVRLKGTAPASFCSEYSYVDVPFFDCRFLNRNAVFLQVLTLVNMTSPFFSLLVPLLMMFVPFFLLKMRGEPIRIAAYVDILKDLFKKSNLGRLFSRSSETTAQQRVYLAVSFLMYVYQIYQNVMVCWNFHKNLTRVHEVIIGLRQFLKDAVQHFDALKDATKGLGTYTEFNRTMEKQRQTALAMIRAYTAVTPYSIYRVQKVAYLGVIMQHFYEIYDNDAYNACVRYCFGLVGYVQNVLRVKQRVSDGEMSWCNLDLTDETPRLISESDQTSVHEDEEKEKGKEEKKEVSLSDAQEEKEENEDDEEKEKEKEEDEEKEEKREPSLSDAQEEKEKEEDEEKEEKEKEEDEEDEEKEEDEEDEEDEEKEEDEEDEEKEEKEEKREPSLMLPPCTELVGAYYPGLVGRNGVVRNDYSLDKSLSVTGPNASGKTTMIKTVLCNVLFSQQMGCGFYQACNLQPYHQLHCYMNIPDTSARDSLFQAEARRCKHILDKIDQSAPSTRHLCIFDELYSGTNPYEAVGSAYAFLKYVSKRDVTFLLTTHYLDLCERLKDEPTVRNCHMRVDHKASKDESVQDGEGATYDYHYTYRFVPGISTVRGGVKVLKDMRYPPSVIRTAHECIR